MSPIRTILHPTDFSKSSRHAFGLACSLARDHGSRLVVLHVGRFSVMGATEGVIRPMTEREEEELTIQLHQIGADETTVPIDHELVFGDSPSDVIVESAKLLPADLIVMGTHGRVGVRRFVLGSVAEQVLRNAPCPVVTVKVPAKTAQTAKAHGCELAGKDETLGSPLVSSR